MESSTDIENNNNNNMEITSVVTDDLADPKDLDPNPDTDPNSSKLQGLS